MRSTGRTAAVLALLLAVMAGGVHCSQSATSGGSGSGVGNPVIPVGTTKLMAAVCGVINRCQPQVILSSCQAGVLQTSGIAGRIGLSNSTYGSYSSIVQAETSGSITTNPSVTDLCTKSISDVACTDSSVLGAYDPTASNPYAGVVNLIPDGICGAAFSTSALFIDYLNGSDLNEGNSRSAPWKNAPGMVGCAGKCAAKVPVPGESYILKGGVTWPASTMTWNWNWSGSATGKIYIGVDPAWYVGTSWSRPILNGGGAVVTGGGNSNTFVNLGSANQVTFDNIELTGLYWDSNYNAWGNTRYIDYGLADHLAITNCYMHGWSHASAVSGAQDAAVALQGDTHFATANVGTFAAYNIIDGSDTDRASMKAMYAGSGTFFGNVIRYVNVGFNGACLGPIHDNVIEYVNDSFNGNSATGLGCNSSKNAAIYNNVIRHITATGSMALSLAPCQGGTDFVFNNVIYDIANQAPLLVRAALDSGQGSLFVLNNTMECGTDVSPSSDCVDIAGSAQLTAVSVVNNHLITTSATSVTYPGAAPMTKSNNIVQDLSTANAQGYSATNLFHSSLAGAAATGAGLNSSGRCTGSATPLCGTSDAAGAVSTVPRPASGSWNSGAY